MPDDNLPPDVPLLFGEFPVEEATGLLLAHSLNIRLTTATSGQPAWLRLRKGHQLTREDIGRLQAAGLSHVSGARPGPDDITENPAAAHVAALLAGAHTAPRPATGGRCNLHATADGILHLDSERVVRVNLLGEAIAIGTLPPWSQARKGQVIATVKIIPAAVPRQILDACASILATPAVQLAPLQPHRAALIISRLPEQRSASPATMEEVTRQRLAGLHSRLALTLHCPHDSAALSARIRQAQAAGCDLILISGAAGTKDRQDLVPQAIMAAGGHIERFGLPVEPGNMLLLARLGETPLLVLPGCARSRRLNGLDWILQRLIANLPLDRESIARMGIGGLIRQQPGILPEPMNNAPTHANQTANDAAPLNEAAVPPAPCLPADIRRPDAPRVAALILAAGAAQRMAGQHKLLAEIDGIPLVLRAVNAALASRASSVSLITGKCNEAISALLAAQLAQPTRLRCLHNADYASGMASSLALGIRHLPADSDAVLVMLADMPLINANHLDQLIDAYLSHHHQAQPPVIVPMHNGQRGNPVLWPRRCFSQMLDLTGDQGARSLLHQPDQHILACKLNDAAILTDIDTPQDLHKLMKNN